LTTFFESFAWFVWAELLTGIAKNPKDKACNECKHLVDWEWIVSKCSDTNVVFQTVVFLIQVVRKTKSSPGINNKTSDCPGFVYIIVIMTYVQGQR